MSSLREKKGCEMKHLINPSSRGEPAKEKNRAEEEEVRQRRFPFERGNQKKVLTDPSPSAEVARSVLQVVTRLG